MQQYYFSDPEELNSIPDETEALWAGELVPIPEETEAIACDGIMQARLMTELETLFGGRNVTTWLRWLETPHWTRAGRICDWRNHVPEGVRDMWSELSLETRIVALLIAQEAASAEDWS